MILELFGMRLATFVDIGKELGVSTNQVYMWHNRRQANGFPKPIMLSAAGNGVKAAPWFDLEEVTEWRASYVPPKGGYHTHRARRAS